MNGDDRPKILTDEMSDRRSSSISISSKFSSLIKKDSKKKKVPMKWLNHNDRQR